MKSLRILRIIAHNYHYSHTHKLNNINNLKWHLISKPKHSSFAINMNPSLKHPIKFTQ
jgi:hypothetical protein